METQVESSDSEKRSPSTPQKSKQFRQQKLNFSTKTPKVISTSDLALTLVAYGNVLINPRMAKKPIAKSNLAMKRLCARAILQMVLRQNTNFARNILKKLVKFLGQEKLNLQRRQTLNIRSKEQRNFGFYIKNYSI